MLELRNQSDGVIQLLGALELSELKQVRSEFGKYIEKQRAGSLVVDCAGLETTNSVVVSLVLCLIRKAAQVDCKLSFRSVPAGLQSMARVGGLESLMQPYCSH